VTWALDHDQGDSRHYRLRQSGLSRWRARVPRRLPRLAAHCLAMSSCRRVSRFFPDITRETSTGRNSTATGNPKATRMVIYETGEGSKKITITVDRYGSSSDASSAYQEAVQKSQSVPGFKPVPVPTLGQQTFAGTTTMGGETHIGLGALDHKLIVGATLAGYDATPDNAAKLVAVARMQGAAAKRAVGPSGSR
jgi:hypothetical protein